MDQSKIDFLFHMYFHLQFTNISSYKSIYNSYLSWTIIEDWSLALGISYKRRFQYLNVVSTLWRFCNSIITLNVSLAWCGLNSLSRWWMWINKRLRSSTFSALLGESGQCTKRSNRSKKFTSREWFSFFNSLRLSKCIG